jgi:hypothetical protein
LGHFFAGQGDSFVCSVTTDKSASTICGQVWKKSGGSRRRKIHIQKGHHVRYDAVMEFRQYLTWIQGISNVDDDDDDVPGTPQKATVNKFENVREERILQQMQRLLPHEERLCYDSLMGLILRQGGSFSLVYHRTCDDFAVPSTITSAFHRPRGFKA